MYIVAIHVHVHVYGNEYVHLHDKVYYSVDLPNWSSSLSICHNWYLIHVVITQFFTGLSNGLLLVWSVMNGVDLYNLTRAQSTLD